MKTQSTIRVSLLLLCVRMVKIVILCLYSVYCSDSMKREKPITMLPL